MCQHASELSPADIGKHSPTNETRQHASKHIKSAPLFTLPHVKKGEYFKRARANGSVIGIAIACTIMVSWAGALYASIFSARVASAPLPLRACLAALLTWLYTGLFVTAHDAMHGLIAPRFPALNHTLGWICTRAYASFDYQLMLHAHWAHHRNPAEPGLDPDFHDGQNRSPAAWFAHFMLSYMTVRQLAAQGATFNLLWYCGVPPLRLLCAWVAPSLLSAVQLFYFGTFLPHREPDIANGVSAYADRHRARTPDDRSALWHFVTCFNFGLHHEHHLMPFVPWWRLPTVRRASGAHHSD